MRYDQRTLEERWEERVSPEPNTGCWLWTGGVVPGGYGSFSRKGGGWLSAHRASWEIHHGPIPDGLFVLHHCDNRLCVNPDHLFLGTHTDNARDRALEGRNGDTGLAGEANSQAKLTLDQIAVIRLAREVRGVVALLARSFGVSEASVSNIRSGRSWKE